MHYWKTFFKWLNINVKSNSYIINLNQIPLSVVALVPIFFYHFLVLIVLDHCWHWSAHKIHRAHHFFVTKILQWNDINGLHSMTSAQNVPVSSLRSPVSCSHFRLSIFHQMQLDYMWNSVLQRKSEKLFTIFVCNRLLERIKNVEPTHSIHCVFSPMHHT